jgi:hypothetical protein
MLNMSTRVVYLHSFNLTVESSDIILEQIFVAYFYFVSYFFTRWLKIKLGGVYDILWQYNNFDIILH